MFEKAKILQQLGRLEDAVETTGEVRGILSKLASTSGCLKDASRFVRENDASEFGGAYLVSCFPFWGNTGVEPTESS